MPAKEIKPFDNTKIYKEEVEPLLKKLDIICKAGRIPYFFTACVKNSEDGSEYENMGNLCGSNGFSLKEDKITDFVRILAGFKYKKERDDGYTLIPPERQIELNFGEFEM